MTIFRPKVSKGPLSRKDKKRLAKYSSAFKILRSPGRKSRNARWIDYTEFQRRKENAQAKVNNFSPGELFEMNGS